MKNILIKILCLLGLIGCNSSSNTGREIFLYDTLEYKEVVKNSKISLNDAEKIICDAIKQKILLFAGNKNTTKNHFALSKNIGLRHYLIYMDYYVFIYQVPTHAGTVNISSGLFINRKTGDLIQKPNKDTNEKILIRINREYALVCNK